VTFGTPAQKARRFEHFQTIMGIDRLHRSPRIALFPLGHTQVIGSSDADWAFSAHAGRHTVWADVAVSCDRKGQSHGARLSRLGRS